MPCTHELLVAAVSCINSHKVKLPKSSMVAEEVTRPYP